MHDPTESPPPAQNPWLALPHVNGAAYDAPYVSRAEDGEDIHGEARAVLALHRSLPLSVLDAGCGTGRISIELARCGADTVGVDLDPRMLDWARAKAPTLDWRCADLATVNLERRFDVILLAGNVMLFVTPGTEVQVVANLARHLGPGGLLVTGFQLDRTAYGLAQYDAAAATAGLRLRERWASWDGAPWTPANSYVVSIHHRVG